MTDGSQAQRAGANSQQIQVAGDLVLGVSEERARQIMRDNFRELYAQYSAESFAVAEARVEELQERLIPDLVEANLMSALADPAFQVTLRKAQLGAASTERDGDYDTLSNLLLDRAGRAGNRHVRAGINRAVEIVDQLDDIALSGLTVFAAATELRATNPVIDTALAHIKTILQQVMENQTLPQGRDWIDHLEILSAVRIDEVQDFLPFPSLWSSIYVEHLSTGVAVGSVEAEQGEQRLKALGLQSLLSEDRAGFLRPHEFKPGWVRWDTFIVQAIIGSLQRSGWSDEQIEQIDQIGREVYGADQKDESLIPLLMDRVRLHPYQAALETWWSTLKPTFTLTVVGKVLARAQARNLDKLGVIPPIA